MPVISLRIQIADLMLMGLPLPLQAKTEFHHGFWTENGYSDCYPETLSPKYRY